MATLEIMDIVEARHNLLRVLREFFYEKGYIEVETPNLLRSVPPDPFVDPLSVYISGKGPFFLHTSPEVSMKKMLSLKNRRIFQICKVFREETETHLHSIEFTMLEWYREGDYRDGAKEVMDLFEFISERLDFERKTLFKRPFSIFDLEQLFLKCSPINPFSLERGELIERMKRHSLFHGKEEDITWNDLFFILFFSEIEGKIREEKPYFVFDWPLSISSMAKRKDKNKVERFEVYMEEVELANGYTELLDPAEQRERFVRDNEERKRIGKPLFAIDETFFSALSNLSGSFTGVSLGVDRLLMMLLGKKSIKDVLPEVLLF